MLIVIFAQETVNAKIVILKSPAHHAFKLKTDVLVKVASRCVFCTNQTCHPLHLKVIKRISKNTSEHLQR